MVFKKNRRKLSLLSNFVCMSLVTTNLSFCQLAFSFSGANLPPPYSQKNTDLLQKPYQYFANGEPTVQVLSNFARSFGLNIKGYIPQGQSMRGKIGDGTASDFIQTLANNQGFRWFVFGNDLYISDSKDHVVRAISISPGSGESLRRALTEIKLLDPQFGWGLIPEDNVVIVSGPKNYVDLLHQQIAQLNTSFQTQTMVFKLKYATVNDRVIQYRDKEIVTLGVASILRSILNDSSKRSAGQRITQINQNPITPGLMGSGSDFPQNNQNVTPTEPTANPIKGSSGQINPTNLTAVESDPRLNAIIIRDHPHKMPFYQNLINELDIPSKLVEIEASILEIETGKLEEFATEFGFGSSKISTISSTGVPSGIGIGLGNNSAAVVNNIKGFNAKIRALENASAARILGSPSILTTDNLGAFLDLTQTFYTKVQGERVANLVPVTAGTTLRVTPHIIEENNQKKIQLLIDIEDGAVPDRISINDVPVVKKTNISTQAVINEGQSLLIGGYNTDRNVENVNKIPILSSIPLIGGLFQGTTKEMSQRKRLFLITPRIHVDEKSEEKRLSLKINQKTDHQLKLDQDINSNIKTEIKPSYSPLKPSYQLNLKSTEIF